MSVGMEAAVASPATAASTSRCAGGQPVPADGDSDGIARTADHLRSDPLARLMVQGVVLE